LLLVATLVSGHFAASRQCSPEMKTFKLNSPFCTALFLIAFFISCAQAQMLNPAQAGINAAMIKLFGDTKAFSSKATVRLLDKNKKETMTMTMDFALLDGKFRADIDLNQIKGAEISAESLTMLKTVGMDKWSSIILPQKKTTIVVVPALKSYAEAPMQVEEGTTLNEIKLGKETIEGHICEKYKVSITGQKGQKHQASVWKATNMKNFPLQMEMEQDDGLMVMLFRDVRLGQPNPALFAAPAGYTRQESMEQMIANAMLRQRGK
jgi:hypothetical protein